MNIKKKVLVFSMTTILSASVFATGTLTLTSINEPNTIAIKCGSTPQTEIPTPFPILPKTPRVLRYDIIQVLMGKTLYCDFFDNSTDIGSAHIEIASDSSTATVDDWTNKDPANFDVALSSPKGVPTPSLLVTLTKH